MLWLVGQIAVFMIIAAVIGFVIGWLLRGWWRTEDRDSSTDTEPDEAPSAAELDAAHSIAAALGQKKAAAEVKRQFAATKSRTPDDLQEISGVGPKLEGLLNSMNITTFEQVGGFTPADIAMVTAALNSFKDRIIRDNWVGQAKELWRAQSND